MKKLDEKAIEEQLETLVKNKKLRKVKGGYKFTGSGEKLIHDMLKNPWFFLEALGTFLLLDVADGWGDKPASERIAAYMSTFPQDTLDALAEQKQMFELLNKEAEGRTTQQLAEYFRENILSQE